MLYLQFAIESFEKCSNRYTDWHTAVWTPGGQNITLPDVVGHVATRNLTGIREGMTAMGNNQIYWLDFPRAALATVSPAPPPTPSGFAPAMPIMSPPPVATPNPPPVMTPPPSSPAGIWSGILSLMP